MNLKQLFHFHCKRKTGTKAPDFSLPSQSGDEVRLSDFFGKKCVVLYFYPKDNTYGCIAESCSFRDSYDVFREAGADVIGISSDTPESHAEFSRHYRLPFTLLSDASNSVRQLYGVPSTMGVIPGRVTYVIDKAGVIRHVFSSQFSPASHVVEALRTLKTIQAKGQ